MKIRNAVFSLLSGALFFTTNIVPAQPTDTAALSLIEATTPTPSADVPEFGTFYSAQNSDWAPSPADLVHVSAWSLGDGFWLLDDLDYDYSVPTTESFSRRGMSLMDDLEGDDLTPAFTFPTNGLWLQITNVSNGLAYVNLMNATDSVYEIWSKTGMAQTNWTIEQEVWPTDTNCMPFTVAQSNRTNLFLWARDWTGITSNGNTTPEWWFWKNFGTVDLTDTNLDSTGENTLLYDYQNGIDPNFISFSLQFTNDYFTSSPVHGTIGIQGGEPFYEAVLVNDADTADAVWQPFASTNLAVDLSDGFNTIYVGLRGLPADAQQTWQEVQLTVNTTPLTLAITNPASTTVSMPMIQVQGYASKPLSSLAYDISNAAGIFTNQTGYLAGQSFDTNLQMFTVNYFQCYDIPLTNGLNIITLHATDVAGNTTTTNVSCTLDYSGDTTAPVLSVVWPTNGTSIGGSNFTMQAQVDDNTATVTASITDTNGDTNIVAGLVERGGAVWFNNLPLGNGTNVVTITTTDAAGNMSGTNIAIVQSSVNVTIDPLTDDNAPNQASVTVTGSVSNPDDSVTVNGVTADMNDDGTWEADAVTVSQTGTADLDVEVKDSGGNPAASQVVSQPQPPLVVLSDFKQNSSADFDEDSTVQWDYVGGGSWSSADTSGPILPDGTNYTSPWVVDGETFYGAESGTFAPHWQNANASYYNGNTYQTSIQTTVMIVPQGRRLPGVIKTYTVRARAEQFSPLIGYPDLGDDSFFLPEIFSGYSYGGNAPVPSAQLLVNGQPLSGSVTNNDGPLWGQNIWGQTTVSAPAGALVPLTVTSTNPTNNDYTFGVEIVQDKLYWQNMVQAEIDNDSGVMIENYLAGNGFLNNRANIKAVYAFYQKLFTEQPTEFYWAGLAKLAGAPVYAGLSDAENLKGSGFVIGSPSPALAIALGAFGETYGTTFQNDLIQMNIDVYSDLAWQFEAYKNGGLDALEEIYAVDKVALDLNAITAWQEIDDGVQNDDDTEIQEGNQRLLQREQQQILANGYLQLSDLTGAITLMTEFAENPVDNISALSFSSLEPSGSIAVFDDRWDWITRPYISVSDTGIWPLWLQFAQSTQLSSVEIPLKTRAADYSLAAQYSFLSLPIQ